MAFVSHVHVREGQKLREDLVKDYTSGIEAHLLTLSAHIQVHCRSHTKGFGTAYQKHAQFQRVRGSIIEILGLQVLHVVY
jgi:hypothetical protein